MRFSASLASLAALLAAPASAVTLIYPDFSSTAGLQLNGSATPAVDSFGRKVLRLTPPAFFQAGSVFSTTPITLGADVSFDLPPAGSLDLM
jgi:hypothetical protein